MKRLVRLLILALIIGAGCSSLNRERVPTGLAAFHMNIADSLERHMELRQAAAHYSFVAEEYPRSPEYRRAVRKAALLYSSELNPARNDSMALRWFTAYLALPMVRPEREDVQTSISLLREIRLLRGELAHRLQISDSIAVAAKRQGQLLTRRIQDLEEELAQVQAELDKLKEIDLRLSKSRVRK
jgi:hypothetical protein